MTDRILLGHETVDRIVPVQSSQANTGGPRILINPQQPPSATQTFTADHGAPPAVAPQRSIIESASRGTMPPPPPRPPPPPPPPRPMAPPPPPQPSMPFEDTSFLDMGNPQKMRMDADDGEDDDVEEAAPMTDPYGSTYAAAGASPGGEYYQGQGYFAPAEQPRDGFKTLEDERKDIINKLFLLKKKGFTVNQYSIHSNIHDMRSELDQIMHTINSEASVKFARKMLVACTSGLEFLNRRYDPFSLKLDGWSESVMENITDYDGVFERLYQKYSGSGSVPPEIELMMSLVGSMMMFHLTNTMFKQMMAPVANNPAMMQSMMQTMMQQQQKPPPPPQQQQSQRVPDSDSDSDVSFDPRDGPREMRGPSFPPRPSMSSRPKRVVTEDELNEAASDMSSSIEDLDDMSIHSSMFGGSDADKVIKIASAPPKKRARRIKK